MTTNKEKAEELLKVICKSEAHNTAWMLQFALAIYEIGNENGWENHQESVFLNSSYPTDYNYD
jgi:hypothetical protein